MASNAPEEMADDFCAGVHAIAREISSLQAALLQEHDEAVRRLLSCKVHAANGSSTPEEKLPVVLDAAACHMAPLSGCLPEANEIHTLREASEDVQKQRRRGVLSRSNSDEDEFSGTVSQYLKESKSTTREFNDQETRAKEDAKSFSAQLHSQTCDLARRSVTSVTEPVGRAASFGRRVTQPARQTLLVLQAKLRAFTETAAFEAFFAVAIIANAFAVGVEVNSVLRDPGAGISKSFTTMNYLFSFTFMVELVCRLGAHGRAFFCSSQWSWNYFDLAIVLASVVEIVGNLMGADTLGSGMGGRGARLIRVVRVTRFIRIFRVARLMRFVRALRQLLHSIFCTLQEVVWAFVLIFILVYVFAIIIAQVVSGKALEEGNPPTGALHEYWGTIPRSMWALFMSISGGVNWREVVEPLEDVWAPLVALFSFYVTFTIFAMLNVITGVFCESAIAAARTDAEHVCQENLLNKRLYMQRVKTLFHTIGRRQAEGITYDELEEFLADEMAAGFFAALDIDISDVWTLFKLLDENESRIIDLEEFVAGCFRLKGGARSIDVALMGYEHKLFRRCVFQFIDHTEARLKQLGSHLRQASKGTNGEASCTTNTQRPRLDYRGEAADRQNSSSNDNGNVHASCNGKETSRIRSTWL
eukprot:TRINITY_DN24145_c1_g1_i1.p1 TRINITY_DN24145_c1_g1~~TRINITY_DN24145_c1_g1_i1.p1  ORF type:complete len:644 (+),score=101.67 TRINITY_DN24145_c1_g1_i1:113-2044(+)